MRRLHDPAFRLISSEKIWDRGAALTSRLQSFETELLAENENVAGLATINREPIGNETADFACGFHSYPDVGSHFPGLVVIEGQALPFSAPQFRQFPRGAHDAA